MKKLLTLLCAASLLSLGACQNDEIWDKLNDHDQRLEQLETQCRELNSTVEAMQTMLLALQQNEFVTDIKKITEADDDSENDNET